MSEPSISSVSSVSILAALRQDSLWIPVYA